MDEESSSSALLLASPLLRRTSRVWVFLLSLPFSQMRGKSLEVYLELPIPRLLELSSPYVDFHALETPERLLLLKFRKCYVESFDLTNKGKQICVLFIFVFSDYPFCFFAFWISSGRFQRTPSACDGRSFSSDLSCLPRQASPL